MEETARYIGHWLRAWTAFERTLPQPCKVLSSGWHSSWVFKRLFQCSKKSVVLEWCWIPWAWAHCHTPFAVKWVLWSEHYCEARWIRHSVSTCLVVLHTGKHCIQGMQIHIQSVYSLMSLPWCKWPDVINLPPGSWPITPGNGSVLGMDVSLWFWQISTQQ